MVLASALPALMLMAAAAPTAGGTPLTEALRAKSPAIAALIEANPGIEQGWAEPFWREALLEAPPIPGTLWRVHDLARPQPPVVQPGNCPTPHPDSRPLGAADFTGDRIALWQADGDSLTPSGTTNNRIHTREAFGDVELSLEFRMPAPPVGVFQARGNSGLFFQQRYEVQILDSWKNPTYPDGQMGALYGQVPPRANASRPPGAWQCLTVRFRAARFGPEGKLVARPRATVILNGITLQQDQPFLGPTAFARILPFEPHPERLPISLQDHGDPGGRLTIRAIRVRELPPE